MFVVFFQLSPLGSRIVAVKLNVLVRSVELPGDLRLYALVRGNNDLRCPV